MALDIDRYAGNASALQRWDPRIKIFSLGVFAFCIALLDSIPLVMIGFLLAATLVVMSRLPLHFVQHGLEFVLIFLIPFFIVLPLTIPGEAMFHVFGIAFAWEGLRLAVMIVFKAISVVMTTYAIFGTTRFDTAMIALQRLRCPTILVQMFLFTYRFIFVFVEEIKRKDTAMKSRGFEKRFDMRTLTTVGNFIGTLIIRSFERTERVYKAMLSKGYTGEFHTLRVFQAETKDWIKAVLIICIAVALTYVDVIEFFPIAQKAWY
ncbi:MAG: cobalt ECF transporter T component CbiQ [Gammaproteobacteria bacterium]|nr:cobalt ECF transporter T component CbiQ [Gammaproteobacteria bacterium]